LDYFAGVSKSFGSTLACLNFAIIFFAFFFFGHAIYIKVMDVIIVFATNLTKCGKADDSISYCPERWKSGFPSN